MTWMKLTGPLLVSLLVALLVQIAVPQETLILSIGSFVLVMWFVVPVFVIGIPSIRDRIVDFTNINRILLLTPVTSVIFPYILLSVFAGSFSSLSMVVVWYFIPNLILILPLLLSGQNKKLHSVFYVLGAIMLWIGFDHRYTAEIFDIYTDLNYVMNSIWMVNIGYVTFGITRGMKQQNNPDDLDLVPTKAGSIIANKMTPLASLFIIPVGLLTGFLVWNPVEFDLFEIIVGFIGIYLTIALQEEMIFRGIILQEVDTHLTTKIQQSIAIILVSLVFALTHWNNETSEYVLIYFITAFVAGIAYGISYRVGGMYGAMLSHTLIDWFWSLLLKRA